MVWDGRGCLLRLDMPWSRGKTVFYQAIVGISSYLIQFLMDSGFRYEAEIPYFHFHVPDVVTGILSGDIEREDT